MPNVLLKIDRAILPAITESVRDIARQLKDELAIEIGLPEGDPELSSCWRFGLLEELNADCHNLLFLLGNESFGRLPIPLEVEFAEGALRGCAAVRHKLRSTLLTAISDCDLESGELNIADLSPELQRPYACYLFLAFLQEAIIESLQYA